MGWIAATIYVHSKALRSILDQAIPPFIVKLVKPVAERITGEFPPRMLVPHHPGTGSGGGGGGGSSSSAFFPRPATQQHRQPRRQQAGGTGGTAAPPSGGAAAAVHPVFGQVAPSVLPHQVAQSQRNPVAPDAQAVEQLMAMGFGRDQVVAALQFANNDVARAADRLLTQQATGI